MPNSLWHDHHRDDDQLQAFAVASRQHALVITVCMSTARSWKLVTGPVAVLYLEHCCNRLRSVSVQPNQQALSFVGSSWRKKHDGSRHRQNGCSVVQGKNMQFYLHVNTFR